MHTAPYPPIALPDRSVEIDVGTLPGVPEETGAVGWLLCDSETAPEALGVTAERLTELAFTAKRGTSLQLAGPKGPIQVLLGAGERAALNAAGVRDAAAVLAREVPQAATLALVLPDGVDTEAAAAAAVEGVVLARYAYRIGKAPDAPALKRLTLLTTDEGRQAAEAGVARGRILVRTAELARDLAGTPGGMLTATRLGDIAVEVGQAAGLEVELFGEKELLELGCGGLLGINLGSVEPPVMVKLVYRPAGEPSGRLTLVGKGITYDSGGLALKPGDEVHATMKNDMTGAGAILAAMTALRDLGCAAQVTGYLMCTDNMPSGSALRLGDIVVMRGGTTVEVINTDAEGRMVMADALVLAREEPVDAIVDIATLTGAALATFGPEIAAMLGTSDDLLDQVRASADRVDELVWELPLVTNYRDQLDSVTADLRNLGGPTAGTITAALFLKEFIGDVPWAHLDIAGPAQASAARGWRNRGTTGFGARLLLDLALNFRIPA